MVQKKIMNDFIGFCHEQIELFAKKRAFRLRNFNNANVEVQSPLTRLEAILPFGVAQAVKDSVNLIFIPVINDGLT